MSRRYRGKSDASIRGKPGGRAELGVGAAHLQLRWLTTERKTHTNTPIWKPSEQILSFRDAGTDCAIVCGFFFLVLFMRGGGGGSGGCVQVGVKPAFVLQSKQESVERT